MIHDARWKEFRDQGVELSRHIMKNTSSKEPFCFLVRSILILCYISSFFGCGSKYISLHQVDYIDELAHELKLEAKLINDISELTVDYTFSRYPDVAEGVPYEEYTEEIAQEKVAIARKIFAELESIYNHIMKGWNSGSAHWKIPQGRLAETHGGV